MAVQNKAKCTLARLNLEPIDWQFWQFGSTVPLDLLAPLTHGKERTEWIVIIELH